MKTPQFAVGDTVKVKDLDELRRDFGANIHTPCSFISEMYKFCGHTMEVIAVFDAYNDEGQYFYYELKGGDDWNFDECVLDDFLVEEPQIDIDQLTMHYESLF